MLRLKTLRLKNFGAFRGEQEIDLPQEEGVSVFYGENMRGKTTLLNAFRYALFGKVIGRGRRPVSFHDMINWEARAAGERTFEVELRLEHAGAEYRLIRTCRPKSGTPNPAAHDDYTTEYYLERGGHILPKQQAAVELERILPEEIARFFLFDGELLQEYEDLLHGDTDMGPKISLAIERILGLPTLTTARDSLKAALDRAEARVALAAQGDQKTRELGNHLQGLVEERDVLTADLFRQEGELEELRARKAAVEDDMRRRERMSSLLEKRDRLQTEVAAARKFLDDQREGSARAMAPAWTALIRSRLHQAVADHRRRELELQAEVTRAQVLRDLADGRTTTCPTCLQPVGAHAQQAIGEKVGAERADETASKARELGEIRRRLDAIEDQLTRTSPEALSLLWTSLEAKRREIYAKTTEIEEVEKYLSGDTEDELRGLRRSYDTVVREIIALEDGVKATAGKLAVNGNNRENIQKRLDRLGGGQVDLERRRRDLTARLHDLLRQGVDTYREDLRIRVEADASRYFRMLTTEPDYEGLRINDSYGLTIIHADGTTIPVRSAGAEHVVALSLVAALQNNAQLRGPIVVDSPFGRLDGGHRANIIETLPEMADQVVLLVYEDELPPVQAREALKGRLKAEWALERRSARHTELVQR